MISVIIPVYNCEKYLYYAINSVLNQNYDDYELIVVDDGSTDRTLDVALEYHGITVLSKVNGGTGSALNYGIEHSKGEWIKWLSADDMLYFDALKTMMKYVSTTPKHDNCIFYTPYDIINEENEVIGHFEEYPKIEQFENMKKCFFGNGSTTLIHRNVFKKIGLFAELPHSEDYEFWLRALSKGVRMELIPEYTLRYRNHPDQLTHKVGGTLDNEIKAKYT